MARAVVVTRMVYPSGWRWRRPRGRVAAGAGPVFDRHRLAPLLLQLLADDAREGVGEAAGREADDQVDALRRISLRGWACARLVAEGRRQRRNSGAE